MTRWRWLLRGYYADDVAPPKRPGELATEIAGTSKEALALDLSVLQERDDIGEIVGPFEVPR